MGSVMHCCILFMCQVCASESNNYKCPRCGCLTCSLECCKKHKAETNCNGKRDRVSYIPLSSIQESTLRNDFHFLEDVLQSKDSAKRISQKHFGIAKEGKWKAVNDHEHPLLTGSKQAMQNLSKGCRRLLSEAKIRGTNLSFLPSGMSKRINNKSSFSNAEKSIKWTLQTVFIINVNFEVRDLFNPELETSSSTQIAVLKDSLVGIKIDSVDENIKIEDILKRFLDNRPEHAVQRHALRSLRTPGKNLRCLIQKIPSPANSPVFIELQKDWTLKEALKEKVIVEYPTLFFGFFETTSTLRTFVCENTHDRNEIFLPDPANKEDNTISEEPLQKKIRVVEAEDELPAPQCAPGEVPSLQRQTDGSLLSLPLANYESDDEIPLDGLAVELPILRIVNKDAVADLEKIETADSLKARFLGLKKSMTENEGVNARIEEEDDESGEDGEELEEVLDSSVEQHEASAEVEEELLEMECSDDDSDEVIELDSESAGLLAAMAALQGRDKELIQSLLGNLM